MQLENVAVSHIPTAGIMVARLASHGIPQLNSLLIDEVSLSANESMQS